MQIKINNNSESFHYMIQDQTRQALRVDSNSSRHESNRYVSTGARSNVTVLRVHLEGTLNQVDVKHEDCLRARLIQQLDPFLRFAILTRARHDYSPRGRGYHRTCVRYHLRHAQFSMDRSAIQRFKY